MPTTFRQDLSRFDKIELGDSVTYFAPSVTRVREVFVRFDPAPAEPPYGKYVEECTVDDNRGRGWHPTGKVTARDEAGGGWRLDQTKKDPAGVLVTRDNFWGLRKAPGKGATGAQRFTANDTVVACQVCGTGPGRQGGWIGNSGRLPHHGYERPGWRQQTSSCPGALKLPYSVLADPGGKVTEIGRDVLPGLILAYDRHIAATVEYLERVVAGTIDLPSEWKWNPRAPYRDDPNDPRYAPVPPTEQSRYADRQRRVKANTEDELDALRRARAMFQARFDSWRPGGERVLTVPARAGAPR